MTPAAAVAALLEMDDFDPKGEALRMSRTRGFGRPDERSIDEFTRAYIEAALWSSNDDSARLKEMVVRTSQLGDRDPPGEYMTMDANTEEEVRAMWNAEKPEQGEFYVLFDDANIFEGPAYSIYRTKERSEESLDANYSVSDIDDRTLAQMVEDCARFQQENAELLAHGEDSRGGHDFWLTRNHHGAGFWDGDWPDDVGEALTAKAHEYGQIDLYVHDGVVYSH